jgi:protein SCO1/2
MTSNSEPSTAPEKTSGGNRRLIFLAAAGVLIGLIGGWLTIQFATGKLSFGPYEYRGIVMPDPEPVGDFTLTAHNDVKVSLSDLNDQIVLLYFGYTYCPDVCPTTLSSLAQALDKLKQEEKEQIQIVMVSVDPERDTPETLAEYLAHFDPSFLGLTGTEQELAAAAEAFGIFYQKGPGSVESGYLVDHTATVSVMDKGGRLRLLFPFGTPPEDIAADLQHLIKDEYSR